MISGIRCAHSGCPCTPPRASSLSCREPNHVTVRGGWAIQKTFLVEPDERLSRRSAVPSQPTKLHSGYDLCACHAPSMMRDRIGMFTAAAPRRFALPERVHQICGLNRIQSGGRPSSRVWGMVSSQAGTRPAAQSKRVPGSSVTHPTPRSRRIVAGLPSSALHL